MSKWHQNIWNIFYSFKDRDLMQIWIAHIFPTQTTPFSIEDLSVFLFELIFVIAQMMAHRKDSLWCSLNLFLITLSVRTIYVALNSSYESSYATPHLFSGWTMSLGHTSITCKVFMGCLCTVIPVFQIVLDRDSVMPPTYVRSHDTLCLVPAVLFGGRGGEVFMTPR